jgi:hypothetical protein
VIEVLVLDDEDEGEGLDSVESDSWRFTESTIEELEVNEADKVHLLRVPKGKLNI